MPEKFFQWIRSSDMTYVKMLINEAALHDFVDKIGTCNDVQFTDVRPLRMERSHRVAQLRRNPGSETLRQLHPPLRRDGAPSGVLQEPAHSLRSQGGSTRSPRHLP